VDAERDALARIVGENFLLSIVVKKMLDSEEAWMVVSSFYGENTVEGRGRKKEKKEKHKGEEKEFALLRKVMEARLLPKDCASIG